MTKTEPQIIELLYRIDERQKTMNDSLRKMELVLSSKVADDDDFREMKRKVAILWDNRNWLYGVVATASVVGGYISQLVFNYFTRK